MRVKMQSFFLSCIVVYQFMLQPSLHFITSTTSALFADVSDVTSVPVLSLNHADAPVVL